MPFYKFHLLGAKGEVVAVQEISALTHTQALSPLRSIDKVRNQNAAPAFPLVIGMALVAR